jgi:hypothetical protein
MYVAKKLAFACILAAAALAGLGAKSAARADYRTLATYAHYVPYDDDGNAANEDTQRCRPKRQVSLPQGGTTYVYLLADGRIQLRANVYATRLEVDAQTAKSLFETRTVHQALLENWGTSRTIGNYLPPRGAPLARLWRRFSDE